VQASGKSSGNRRQWETLTRPSAAASSAGQAQQQLGEAVAPWRTAGQPAGGLERATGEDVAAAGPVRQLQALTGTGELHQVLADDVAGAQAGIGRWPAPAPLHRRAQGKGRARGRVLLVHVMGLDNVHIPL